MSEFVIEKGIVVDDAEAALNVLRQVGQFNEKFAPHADLVRCDIDEYELSRNIKEGEKKYHTDARD